MVRGDGIAAQCCAHLLGVAAEQTDRDGVPALMLGSRTQQLISEVFRQQDLFRGLPQVNARIVAWGLDSLPKRLSHSSVIVPEHQLLERLRSVTRAGNGDRGPDWTIYGSRPLPVSTLEQRFGSRAASVFAVRLTERAETSACWIESLSEGWLFLLPGFEKEGWILSVGAGCDSLLAESRLVAQQIQSIGPLSGQFPASPAMAVPLSGPKWLACGSAALAFDPLCGGGTGNAVREAILAAAVIRAAEAGAPEDELREHYRIRLLRGFLRHLEICREFYATGHQGAWWQSELELLRNGIEYCRHEIGSASPARYRLQGFELHPLSAVHTAS